MIRFFSSFYSFLHKYIFTIILFFFLTVLSIHLRDINTKFDILYSVFFTLYFLLILHLLSKANKIVSVLVLFILTIFITFDSVFGFVLEYQPTLGIFYSIMETSYEETRGILSMIALPVILLFCLVFLTLLKSTKELRGLNFKRRYSFIIVLFISFVIIPFSVFNQLRNTYEYKLKKTDLYVYYIPLIVQVRYPVIINDIVSFMFYINEQNKFKEYKTTPKVIPEGIHLDSNKKKIAKVIIVIGESNSQQYFSLYGYKKAETTPFLDSLYAEINTPLSVFDGLASATLTRDAVPFALTFMTPQNRDGFNSEKNIIDLSKDNGYSTFWISNQEQVGINDTSIGLISTSSDTCVFLKQKKVDDLNLTKQLAKFIATDTVSQFGIVHLISSHAPYSYMDEIDVQSINVEEDATGRLNNYLRCIHHTDRVIQSIYELMSSKSDDFVILFFSDHGEFLPKNHGYIGKNEDAQLPIPLFCINKSSINVADIMQSYTDSQSGRLNNSNMTYVISEIIGYNVSDSLKRKAADSNDFVYMADRRVVNYSDLIKSKAN